MIEDPPVHNKRFIECADACYEQYEEEELMLDVVWDEMMKCIEACWRRYARI